MIRFIDNITGGYISKRFVESLRNECDWGNIDKTSNVYEDTFSDEINFLEIRDIIDETRKIMDEVEDNYLIYHNWIAAIVDRWDMIQGEEVVLKQDSYLDMLNENTEKIFNVKQPSKLFEKRENI